MYELEVTTESNRIRISNGEDPNDPPGQVVIGTDQVDVLIDWLKEAKEKLEESD